uniref:Taste receptor type 2 n=2 Tax=Gadus morhua TaxID=8049 RepID=A0A8C5FVL4_GADMO
KSFEGFCGRETAGIAMKGTNKLAILIVTGMLAVTTVFFNLYILLMSLQSKAKKKWAPCETIIVALCVGNGAHQLVCLVWMTMDQIDQHCLITHAYYTTVLLLLFSLKFTIMWTTAFLTFYYSTKLVTTPNECYTQLQTAIVKHAAMVVFLIPLMGLVTCMPMMAVFHEYHTNETDALNEDCGMITPDTASGKAYDALYLVAADVLPGLLMIKCCVSISVHLAIHLQHMKSSTNGAHAPKLGTQMRVIRMTLSLVLVFLCFLVVDLYVNYQIAVKHDNAIGMTFFITSFYTTLSAMVLIYGKKTFWKKLSASCLSELPCLPRREEKQAPTDHK